MGMYDTIKNELFCPFCGAKQKKDEFQTKSFGRSLESLDIYKIKGLNYNIYSVCYNCNNCIELNIDPTGIHTLEKGKKQIIKRKKEFKKLFKKR